MSRTHEEFEMLTALAAIDQISDHESDALSDHLQSCTSCQRQLEQMKSASFAYFAHHSTRSQNKRLPAELSERFSRRLARLGIPPGSQSIVNPVRSLRLAIAILAFAVLAPAIAGVLAKHHHASSSEQTELATKPIPHAVVSSVFSTPRQPEARTGRSRQRRLGPIKELPSQPWQLHLAAERLPHFRLDYPEIFQRRYTESFTVPSVPSFPLVRLGKTSNSAKIFELASLPVPGQSDGANALRFIPLSDLTHAGNISGPAQFHLPPLTDGPAFFPDTRH